MSMRHGGGPEANDHSLTEGADDQIADGRSERAKRLRAERRTDILNAARQAFAEKGYHAASIADVIAHAQVARGTFYLYFESKRAIFDELLDEMLQQAQGAVRRIDLSPGAPSAADQMRETAERLLNVLLQHRDLARLLMHEAVGLDADFDAKLAAFYGSIIARIRGALELGQRVGLVRECDASVVAYCVLGSFKEAADHLVVQGDAASLIDPAQRAAFVRAVVDYNLSGVLRGL